MAAGFAAKGGICVAHFLFNDAVAHFRNDRGAAGLLHNFGDAATVSDIVDDVGTGVQAHKIFGHHGAHDAAGQRRAGFVHQEGAVAIAVKSYAAI